MNQESINQFRQKAESALKRKATNPIAHNQESLAELYEKLSIHQIELEMQMDELERVREALSQEKQKFENLYLEAPVAYITINQTGNILMINEAAVKLFNLSRHNVNRVSIFPFIADESKTSFRLMVKRVFKERKEQSGVVNLVRKDTGTQYSKFHLNTYYDHEMEEFLCRVTLTNIAEEKNEFDRLLRIKEQEYRQIAENIEEGLLITEKGIIQSLNPAFSDMLQKEGSFLRKNPLWSYVSREYRPELIRIFQSKEKAKRTIELKLIRESGEKFWAQMNITFYNDASNKAFVVVTDISDRKKTEEALKVSENKLREINITKDKFLSILAHDLKSPFTSIIGFTHLLKMDNDVSSTEKQNEYINNIHTTAKNTYSLLENLLLWSQSQAGIHSFNPQNFNINLVIENNISLFTEIAKSKNIRLKFKKDQKDSIVHADINMVDTVIRNLIANAIKFTPEGGSVIVGINSSSHQKLTVFVIDNGVGIPEDKLEKVFDIGKKTSRLGTNNEKGTGLGLSLCKEFVEKNGGEIWVESKPDSGSSFFFTLIR